MFYFATLQKNIFNNKNTSVKYKYTPAVVTVEAVVFLPVLRDYPSSLTETLGTCDLCHIPHFLSHHLCKLS